MINLSLRQVVGTRCQEAPVRRLTPRAFWLLFSIEGLILVGIFIVVLWFLVPARLPLATTDYDTIREVVLLRLTGEIEDPAIEIVPGTIAPSSSVRGFNLHGQTYYYYLEGKLGFDPLSRGVVGPNDIEIVLRDDGGPYPLVIYRLLSKDRATT